MKDILTVITANREARGWTEYQLAEHSGLPQSTISSWYRKNMIPTLPCICVWHYLISAFCGKRVAGIADEIPSGTTGSLGKTG